jgi:hypothetical protein
MEIDKRLIVAKEWFPLLSIISGHLGTHIKIDTYNKDRKWTEYVRSTQSRLGSFWVMFYRGLGYVLTKQGISMNSVCRSLSIYPMQILDARLNGEPLRRGLDNSGSWVDLYDGEEFIDNSAYFNALEATKIETREDAVRWSYLFSLYGVAWYKSFPFGVDEQITSRGMTGRDFMYELGVLYRRMDEYDRGIVDSYCERWEKGSMNAKLSIVGSVGETASRKEAAREIARQDFSEAILTMKSMEEWTEADFWNEMTELYVRCKTSEDVRSVKQILELKAKTMGLLEEKDRGGTNNFLMLTEKAVVALNGMGILGRRSVVHEQ